MAATGHVDPASLAAIVGAVEAGTPLTADQVNLLARFGAVIDAALDAGFERWDQECQTTARLLAGVVAVVLALVANQLWQLTTFWDALLVGLIAVPLAPIAQDLTSGLSAAAAALKDGR
jgi:hypothetical protein